MTYRDEFDEPPRKKGGFVGSVGPKAAFFVVLIALSFMVGVVWKLYVGGDDTAGQNVPIIRADDNPFKVAPDDPGGMDIPNKDSTIFSSIKEQREADGAQIENLLAENNDEDPLPRSQLFAGLNTDKSADLQEKTQDTSLDTPMSESEEMFADQMEEAENVVESLVNDGVESVMPSIEAPTKVEPVAETPPQLDLKPAPMPEPVVAAPAPVSTPAPSTPATSGDYYIQVASVTSREGAEKEWVKIVAKYPSALADFSKRVESADLGAKGIFYRIQAGPVSQEKAISTCNAIKKITPGGCLVVKK